MPLPQMDMDPALVELYEAGDGDDEVSVLLRLEEGAEPPADVRVVSRFDEILTGRIARGEIPALHAREEVLSLKAAEQVFQPPALEHRSAAPREAPDGEAVGEAAHRGAGATVPRPVPEDGTGVVVGICDWGFDFTHPNFRREDGRTRFEVLWDQRGRGDPLAPGPWGYGRRLGRERIDAALAAADPFQALGYHPADADPIDCGAHGTHVLDILAGGRRVPGSQVGLASGADLVCVHLGTQQLRELENLGDSVSLLEGLDFCRRQAAGRPCVLHLSAGKTFGPKRGTTLLERAVDAMLREPGIALVQSVGNYAATAMHTHARIGPDQRHVLTWVIPPDDRTPNAMEVWYSGEDVFEVVLTAPGGEAFAAALGERARLGDGLTPWGNLHHRRREPNSGLNHVAAILQPRAPPGAWRLELYGREVVDGRLHAWIERDAGSRYQSRFPRQLATSRYTTNTICNCFRAIAVGAHDATRPGRPPARFSSRGPTADGRQKPELSAAGKDILAARSTPRGGWRGEPLLTPKSGTSMAAPSVSGAVALLFQAAGRPLGIHEIRRILIGTSDPTPGPKGRSSTRLGYGYLNVVAAVEAARQLRGTPAPARAGAPPARAPAEAMLGAESAPEAEPAGWAPVAAELGLTVDPEWMENEEPQTPSGHRAEPEPEPEPESESEPGSGLELGWAPVATELEPSVADALEPPDDQAWPIEPSREAAPGAPAGPEPDMAAPIIADAGPWADAAPWLELDEPDDGPAPEPGEEEAFDAAEPPAAEFELADLEAEDSGAGRITRAWEETP